MGDKFAYWSTFDDHVLVVDDIAFLFLVIFDLLLAMLSLLVLLKMMSIWVCHSLVFFHEVAACVRLSWFGSIWCWLWFFSFL